MKKYFKHKIENLLNVSKIVTVHYFEFDKDFSFREEAHDFWELVFVDKESVICTSNGKEIIVNQGEALFHKPNDLHALSSNGVKAPDVFIVSFVCRSEAMRFFENKKIKLTEVQKRYIYALVEDAKQTFDMPFSNPETKKLKLLSNPTLGGMQTIKNNLELLLIDAMRSLSKDEEGEIFVLSRDGGESLVREVIDLMEKRVYGELTVEEIVRKTNYSKSYLFRRFKKSTNKSLMEYYIELKIKTAKKMIRENNYSITEIAEKLNFDTPNYFSKTFKKITGVTPSAYKKRTKV